MVKVWLCVFHLLTMGMHFDGIHIWIYIDLYALDCFGDMIDARDKKNRFVVMLRLWSGWTWCLNFASRTEQPTSNWTGRHRVYQLLNPCFWWLYTVKIIVLSSWVASCVHRRRGNKCIGYRHKGISNFPAVKVHLDCVQRNWKSIIKSMVQLQILWIDRAPIECSYMPTY